MKTAQETITRKGDLEGKKPWGLVDFEAMRHLAPHYAGGWQGANWNALECMLDVLIFGAKKYEPNGWKKGYKISHCSNSLYRHIVLVSKGELVDSETGISHYGHILCNLMFMSYWIDYKPELDDRVQTSLVRDFYAAEREPLNEGEALQALLQVLGGFMNGVDTDPVTEMALIGHAMYYACQAYGFANVPVATRLTTLTKGCSCHGSILCVNDEPKFADPETVRQIHEQFNEANLTDEVRKDALGFSYIKDSLGHPVEVAPEQCTDVGDRPGCVFPHCACGKRSMCYHEPQQPDHGVII
jgi:hypothetical protein